MRGMKALMIRVLIASALFSFAAHAAAPSPLQPRLDRLFTSWTKGNVPGCAAGVIREGRWVAKGGYGSASLEHGVRITPDTVFYTGSVSKHFTAAALLRLVDQGKVALDDNVRLYIPELPDYSPPITIGHLVHHTTGLPDFLGLWIDAGIEANRHSPAEVVTLIAKQQPAFAAGLRYSYSNSNYFLIAEIIRRASGKSLREFANEELFIPLGMKDTRFFDDPTEVVPRLASGYNEAGRGHYRAVRTLYAQVGAGGLLTTINDMGKWTRLFDDPNAIAASPQLGQRLTERGVLSDGTPNDYAFGLMRARERDLDVAFHLGGFNGFVGSFKWIPSKRMGLIALCNWSGAPMLAISENLMSEALK